MTRSEIEKMFAGLEDWDRCIVLFPVGDQTGCRWMGMSLGGAAETCSKVAAEIVTKHLPVADERPPNTKAN